VSGYKRGASWAWHAIKMHVGLCVCFCVGGLVVMGTYAQLYVAYTRSYSEYEKRRVWSIWYHADTAWILVLSATLSAIGFVYSSIFLIATLDKDAWPWGLYAYACFLLFSALYAPLLACERAGWTGAAHGVVVALLVVACSTVALCVWTRLRWSWTEAPFLNLSLTWLAVHCIWLDLVVWGWAWWNGFVWWNSSFLSLRGGAMVGNMHDEDGEGIGEAEQDPRFMI
jgi:hypothetical protein